jgi:hypothetical protein
MLVLLLFKWSVVDEVRKKGWRGVEFQRNFDGRRTDGGRTDGMIPVFFEVLSN